MKNIKYIVMGAVTYFASKYLSGVTGISEWAYEDMACEVFLERAFEKAQNLDQLRGSCIK